MISVLGSFTCITQHTGPAALRPIQRTKQLRLSVLLKDTSAATGNRTHILVFWQHQNLSPVHQTARPRHSDTIWLLVCSSCLCIMYIAGLAFHCKAMPSVSLVPIEKYSHRHSDILMEMPCTDSEAKWHCPYKKGIAGLYIYVYYLVLVWLSLPDSYYLTVLCTCMNHSLCLFVYFSLLTLLSVMLYPFDCICSCSITDFSRAFSICQTAMWE